jgi:hypothetical protein
MIVCFFTKELGYRSSTNCAMIKCLSDTTWSVSAPLLGVQTHAHGSRHYFLLEISGAHFLMSSVHLSRCLCTCACVYGACPLYVCLDVVASRSDYILHAILFTRVNSLVDDFMTFIDEILDCAPACNNPKCNPPQRARDASAPQQQLSKERHTKRRRDEPTTKELPTAPSAYLTRSTRAALAESTVSAAEVSEDWACEASTIHPRYNLSSLSP